MGRKYKDNSLTTLAAGITAVATQLTVASSTGNRFPQVTGQGTPGSATDYFVITLEDSSNNIEKIRVENRDPSSDILGSIGYPLVRGYDGTVARSWSTGDLVDLRWEQTAANTAEDAVLGTGAGKAFGHKASTTTGLTFGYFGGTVVNDGAVTTIADSTVLLTGASTNYVERTYAGVVSANTTGFSANQVPLAVVVTGASGINSVSDVRMPDYPDAGYASYSVAGSGTFTATAAQARPLNLEFTGVLTGNRDVVLPNIKRVWTVYNNTTGDFTLTVKVSGQTGIPLARGRRAVVIGNGTDIVDVTVTEGSGSLASASSLNLGAVPGPFIDISGTTTITALGTSPAGVRRLCRFTGAGLTITHNGTSLICPSSLSITAATNDMVEFSSLGSGNWVVVRVFRATGPTFYNVQGATIASATTTDLSTATGDFLDISGTTTITGFGTLTAGHRRLLRFTGAGLTVTHNATSLICPGAQSIVTRQNDLLEVVSLGSGNWTVARFMRALGSSYSVVSADVASASTVDLGAQPGDFFNITGTTTITALGTSQVGTRKTVQFAGALTLTHNATSLILPGGANITTSAGDCADFLCIGTGGSTSANWRCTNYQKGSGLSYWAWAVSATSAGTVSPSSSDHTKFYVVTGSSDTTFNLPAAATVGSGYMIGLRNAKSSGSVVIDPNSSETIEGQTTLTLGIGSSKAIFCDGTTWYFVENGITSASGTYANAVIFDTSGSWTCPANVFSAQMSVWGAGGGAAAGKVGGYSGSGGGSGAFSRGTFGVTPSTGYTVTVGTGGVGGGTDGASGTSGGTSSVGTVSISATGGGGATGNSTTAGTGGTASGGSLNVSGASGGSGVNTNTYRGGAGGAGAPGVSGSVHSGAVGASVTTGTTAAGNGGQASDSDAGGAGGVVTNNASGATAGANGTDETTSGASVVGAGGGGGGGDDGGANAKAGGRGGKPGGGGGGGGCDAGTVWASGGDGGIGRVMIEY